MNNNIVYKPLTPKIREQLNASFDERIAELKTCSKNGIVANQIYGLRFLQRYINGLPDGVPIPFKVRG